MVDVCGGVSTPAPKKILRNGMDYEPKKTYPPDYSSVPSVRDWQMSPFGNERYDLDEIQRAEKKGFKGRRELEKLKTALGLIEPEKPAPKKSECKICAEKKAAKLRRKNCTFEYLYQPYGPNVFSSMSYNKPESPQPRMYTYLGPSHYAGFIFKTPQPGTISPIPCQDIELTKRKRNFKNVYIPYGPLGELRITPDMYIPMGPSVLPLLKS